MTVRMIRPRDLEWSFGDRVRKVRREAGLTQRQFAAELGVTAASVDAWESDRNKPRDLIGMASLIEDAFSLPHGWVLGYAEPARIRRLPHRDSNTEPAGYQMRIAHLALAG